MNIAVCDDIVQDRRTVALYLKNYAAEHNITYTLKEFSSGEDLLAACTDKNKAPDLIFLDIYMSSINGMDTAKQLLQLGFDGSIVFVTISVQHAVDSYKVGADGYLKKPFSYADFCFTMERCFNKLEANLKTIDVVSERVNLTIYLKEIIYIDTGNHCCFLHINDEIVKVNQAIGMIEMMLSNEPCFLRCHRSFIVNLDQVRFMNNDCFVMSNGEKVLFSVRDKVRVKKYYANYFWQKTRKMNTNRP